MHTLDKVKQNIAKEINKALTKKLVQASNLIFPPNPEFGDLSLPCFDIGKKISKTPVETASWLVGRVESGEVFSSAKAVGPYLNFILNKNYLAEGVIKEITKEKGKYGESEIGKNKKIMIEYSNANTHKEYHVGHLRNICYGDAVNKILSANGYKSIPVSYINDFGIHVAKTLWNYEILMKKLEKKGEKEKYLNEYKKKKELGEFLGKIYVDAVKKEKVDRNAKQLISVMMKKIESRKGAEYKLWEKTRKWSIEQFDKIYKELGVKFDHIYYESEVIEKGMKEVSKLYKKGFLIKSDGAIIADLNKYDLGVLVFLRSDGTALYPVADLPLARKKIEKHRLDKSIYVVDIRQSLYFKQLFKVLELLGYKQDMIHLGHEFVKLPSGMMSSREGNIITYEELKTKLLEKALTETRKRHHKEWRTKKIEEVAKKIVNGAIKFEMVKVGAGQAITFDIDKSLKFEGYTAAYLQYTYARIQSIIRNSKLKTQNSKLQLKTQNLKELKECEIIMKLARYPDVVSKAGESYDPSEIAKYLFELARDFNDYYHSVPVLKAKKEIRDARLVLVNTVAQVIKNGLGLIGIKVVEEM
jgi:arginyl-tRNA synthetase